MLWNGESPILRDAYDDALAGALAVSSGANSTGEHVVVDPETGRRYVANSTGSFVRWMDPVPPSSGGTHVTVNPADTTGAWSIQYDSNGNGFKINKITGDVIALDFDKTPGGGQDPSGFDPKTGLPYGVIRDSNSPSGFYYQGIPVTATGHRLTPDELAVATQGDAKTQTWTGYGSKGQGTYIIDSATGKEVAYIGPTQAASQGSTSLSGFSAVNRPTGSSSGGGSSASSAPVRDYAAEDAASDARSAEQRALDRQLQIQLQENSQGFTSEQSALDRAIRAQEAAQSHAERLQDQRLNAVDAYGRGLTSYDANAYFNALNEAGYDINNLLKRGPDLLTNNALTPSAAALDIIRNGGATGSGGTGGAGIPGVSGAIGAGAPTSQPVSTSGGLGTIPYGADTQQNQIPVPVNPMGQQNGDLRNRMLAQKDQAVYDQQDAAAAQYDNGWVQNPMTGQWSNPYGTQGTDYLSNAAYQQMKAEQQASDPNFINKFFEGASVTPGPGGGTVGDYLSSYRPTSANAGMGFTQSSDPSGPNYWQPGTLDPRLFSPTGVPNGIDPKTFGYPIDNTVTPGNLGNDQKGGLYTGLDAPPPGGWPSATGVVTGVGGLSNTVGNGMPPATGVVTGVGGLTNGLPPAPDLQPRAIMPLARGGTVNSGLALVGEERPGKVDTSAELLIDPTRDARVVPLSAATAQGLARGGMQGYYGGTITQDGITYSATGNNYQARGDQIQSGGLWYAPVKTPTITAAPAPTAPTYTATSAGSTTSATTPSPSAAPSAPVSSAPPAQSTAPAAVAPQPVTQPVATPQPVAAAPVAPTSGGLSTPPPGYSWVNGQLVNTLRGTPAPAQYQQMYAGAPVTTGQPVTQPGTTTATPPPAATGQPTTGGPTQPVSTPGTQVNAPVQPTAQGLGVTPQPDQGLLDYIRQQREATQQMPGPGLYDIAFQGQSPLYQQTYAQNLAQRYGIPVEEALWQAGRNRLSGATLAGLSRPMRY